ncbi:MAG: zinc-binding dehydrogenase [Candidatus Tectomicrobia bacterium]
MDPVIAHTFPLAEAAAAHRYLQERRHIGKVLLATDR